MNILIVAHERNMGGASKSLETIAEELKALGHNVFVIVPFKNGQVYEALRKKGINTKVVFFGWWMYPKNWNVLLKLAMHILHILQVIPERRIARFCIKNQIQLIHSNSSTIDIGARVAQKISIPHVWHFREYGDIDYNLQFIFSKKKCCNYINHVDGKVLFISKDLYQYYQNDIDASKVKIVYNGISKQYQIKRMHSGSSERMIFLIAGNMNRNKRQDVAIKAAKKLRERGYSNFELWIAGACNAIKDSKRYADELRQLAGDKADYIRFLGPISDMVALRSKTDIELVCSKREAWGRVTVEAMMASNPVIGSASGATPELIVDGETGFLFEEGNEKDLADKMEHFLLDSTLVEKMGEAAYKHSEKFLSEYCIEQILSTYQLLV